MNTQFQVKKPHIYVSLLDGYQNNETQNLISKYTFRFNGFHLPSDLIDYVGNIKNTLYICVDHNFLEEYKETDTILNVIFIDHHLAEIDGERYESNAKMMADKYEDLFSELLKYVPHFSKIVVLMHYDLDGLSSGIIARKLLSDISSNMIENSQVANFAKILGSYGDIDPNKFDLLQIFFSLSHRKVIDKKFESVRKNIGNFFKSTRAINDILFFVENCQDIDSIFDNKQSNTKLSNYIESNYDNLFGYINYLKNFNINMADILLLYLKICQSLEQSDSISIKHVVCLMNIILSNECLIKINEIYYNITEKILEQYVGGNSLTPLKFEMTVCFDGYKDNKYKLLVIDSYFDVARSIMFKYDIKVKYMVKQNVIQNYNYKITDWFSCGKNIMGLSKNIACYNKSLNKLTLMSSENDSAYTIARELFNGGGHITNDGALGSCTLESENDLFAKIKLLDIF